MTSAPRDADDAVALRPLEVVQDVTNAVRTGNCRELVHGKVVDYILLTLGA